MSEDDVVSRLIEKHRSRSGDLANITPEMHYNYYGDRGVVDLFTEVKGEEVTGTSVQQIYEVKSESAVREATGCNEIIRQFNRMKEFFLKGTDKEPTDLVMYKLYFVPTDYTLRHISEILIIIKK